jgi:hypothetical protein
LTPQRCASTIRARRNHSSSRSRLGRMDARMLELVALALFAAALCGVAINLQHVMGAGVFAGLSAAIVLVALVLRRSQ